MAYLLLALGVVVILAGLVFAVFGRERVTVAMVLTLGVILCLVGQPGIQSFVVKIAGQEATVTMKDLEAGKTDASAQLAPINQKIQSLSEYIDNQVSFNSKIESRLLQLESRLNVASIQSNPNIVAVPPVVANNSKYLILIFFKDSRSEDASLLKDKLIKLGFQAASTNTTLAETTIGPQPDGSTYIAYSARGSAVLIQLKSVINSALPSTTVTPGGPFSLRRGDAQIYLF